jgi:hypothetical protein
MAGPAALFDLSAFDELADGLNDNSSLYSFVLHTDGHVYIFPQRRFGQRLKRVIRCPADGIEYSRCRELGTLPPDEMIALNGPAAIQGAAQLPGGEDLLFGTNEALYRYRLATDTFEKLFDLRQGLELFGDDGSRDELRQLRGLVVAK